MSFLCLGLLHAFGNFIFDVAMHEREKGDGDFGEGDNTKRAVCIFALGVFLRRGLSRPYN